MAFVVGTFALSASHAAEPKPDAAITTKAIEATVYLDKKIKADARLAADCLAEGRKWMNTNAADAAASLKEDPQLFENRAWEFQRDYTVRSVVGNRYVSMVRSDYADTRGAHPSHTADTILWDKAQNKRISIRPFFTETADNGPTMKAMREAVVASLKVEKEKKSAPDDAEEWFKNEPKLLTIGPVTLAPSTEAGKSSGLTFHYEQNTVGTNGEGDYVVFVFWKTLQPFLTPEGIRIFGGDRPKSDEDDQQ
jgi:hypothetical protein